ncbi:MAG: hypothetical protein ACWIPJ_02325 [Polaribacter sp.]
MKKGFIIFIFFLSFFATNGQEKKKDPIVKTEVVNIITTYNPKISDAKKIKKNPTIKLLGKSKKKKLEYHIFSAPVASTFIPKTGVIKGVDLGVKERIYHNYVVAGYGNYASPYAEFFLYHKVRFNNEVGLSGKYNSSAENVKNSVLNSSFSNFNAAAYYKQEGRDFNWKVGLNTEINSYNWYGLPALNFNQSVINSIDEQQKYNYFNLHGTIKFEDSFIDFGKVSLSSFVDSFGSSEILADINTKLDFPLDFISNYLHTISVKAGVEYLKGKFTTDYQTINNINYSILTAKLHPEYNLKFNNISIKTAFTMFLSLDTENKANNLLLFPDIFIHAPIIKNYLTAYGGFSGDLHTNTYKDFTKENPYVSPTLFITQTAETSNLFVGFKGNITNNISFNLKASTKKEEDKPLFLRNNSKSNGATVTSKEILLKGYEYGNSFGVYYDDVKTTTFFAEAAYDYSKNISFQTMVAYNNYSTTNALEKWNLPSLEASFLAKYTQQKWYATATTFYVSERKDATYIAEFPSSISGVQRLASFVDLNLNGGYHFNDKFSAFLRLNNVLNTKYQRFANFDTQGFQVLGGLTYKFDF